MNENANEDQNMKKVIDFYNENNHIFDNFDKNQSSSNRDKKDKSNSGTNKLILCKNQKS